MLESTRAIIMRTLRIKKRWLILLLLFCHDLFAVKHSLKLFSTGSSGIANVPEVMAVLMVDGIQASYWDSNNKKFTPRLDWMQTFFDNNPERLESYIQYFSVDLANFFRTWILSLKQQFNQREGVQILQMIFGCELDENTGEKIGILQYSYNGEDFLELDLKTLTWRALKSEAVITKHRWDANEPGIKRNEEFLSQICPEWLKMYLGYGKSSLQRTVLPSVSLLQKTDSSPVSCHATGFYPDRAMMFWRKDGEEIHEGVEHKEILPNNDGTFQMSIDLNASLIAPEDWRRYKCVFQLSDTKDIVNKLNKTEIRTNWGKAKTRNSEETTPIIAVVIVLAVLILIVVIGFAVYKKKKETHSVPASGNMSDHSERLNQETNTEACNQCRADEA